MAGRHATRWQLFAADMVKHLCDTLLFKENLCEKRRPSEVVINVWCCALLVTHEMATVFGNASKTDCTELCRLSSSTSVSHK